MNPKIDALRHAIYVCNCKQSPHKHPLYNIACEDIKLSLEASISRLESGDEMESTACAQSPD
jgi:hypothetical protein